MRRLVSSLLLCLMLLSVLAGCANDKTVIGGVLIGDGLKINEVTAATVRAHTNNALDGFVELFNASASAVSLSGYSVTVVGQTTHEFTLPKVDIAAGAYLLLYAAESGVVEKAQYMGFSFPAGAFELTVRDAGGKTVASVPVPSLLHGMSMCLVGESYMFSFTQTPCAANPPVGSCFTYSPSIDIKLSEITRNWVEIVNIAGVGADLSKYSLTDDPLMPLKWSFPAVTLDAGDYYVVGLGGYYEVATGFSIESTSSQLILCKDGSCIDVLPVPDRFSEVSAGIKDGAYVYYLYPTPGEANGSDTVTAVTVGQMDETDPVQVTEVLLKNRASLIDGDGDRSAWVELHNSSDEDILLSRFCLSDNTEELDKWRITAETIEAGEYALVYLSGKNKEMHTGFKVSSGEALYLTDLLTFRTQRIYVADESRLDDISYGVKNSEWLYFGTPTPGKKNTTAGFESITNVDKLSASGLWISEVCATGAARSDDMDWVEIYNDSEDSVDLSTYYLSNDIELPLMFKLKGVISSKGYKVIYANKSASKDNSSVAPFNISSNGETITLTRANGTGVDCFETGALRLNVTSGRASGDYSGRRVFFASSSRGAENNSPRAGYAATPQFSVESGYCDSPITVEIISDGEIYYTLDGSTPTSSSKKYTNPLTFEKTAVLSAIAYKEGCLSSPKAVATYLFVEEHTLPVVCISAAASDFDAVYKNTDKWNQPVVERECYIEYFEPNGERGTSFPCGLRLSGNSTRVYAQKSFCLFLRGAYGQSSVTYPFFKDFPISTFSSLTLRNSGQDCSLARMRDAYCSMLVKGMNVEYAETRFVVCYVNGRYYGIYDLKENQNEDYFAYRHGVDVDTVCVIRRNRVALSGTNTLIKEVYSLAQRYDLDDESAYNNFIKYVDPDAFIDYLIAQSYVENYDFYNQKFAYTSDLEMRVRPVFFDLDITFRSANVNMVKRFFSGDGIPSPNGTLTNMYIPTALRDNDAWREKLLTRFNECFETQFDDASELFDEMLAELEPEMERHIDRWGTPSSLEDWQSNVDDMREAIEEREEQLLKYIKIAFNLSDDEMAHYFG